MSIAGTYPEACKSACEGCREELRLRTVGGKLWHEAKAWEADGPCTAPTALEWGEQQHTRAEQLTWLVAELETELKQWREGQVAASGLPPQAFAEVARLRSTVEAGESALKISRSQTLDAFARVAQDHNEVARLRGVTDQVQKIMATYREQEASSSGVGTPGGLEHMGDVWRLLAKWDKELAECALAPGKEADV